MSNLLQNIWDKLRGKRKLTKLERYQVKFRQRYPDYKVGKHSYGVPIVYNWKDDTTLEIGDYCSIAASAQIFLGGNHRTDWISTYPFPAFQAEAKHIKKFRVSKGNVVIGNDVWLCNNSIILSGVTIGNGAVVAAGAVVTKDVDHYSIVAGNPAQHVKWRFDEPIRAELLRLSWWNWPEEEIARVFDLLCSDDVEKFIEYAAQTHRANPRK